MLNSNLMKDNEYFKIARSGATICDSINNACYFIFNLLPGVSTIIFQVGLADAFTGKTEKMKYELQQFVKLMNEVNINVVILSPIPHLCKSNESFSRALAMNMWLMKQKQYGKESFALVDSFDLFWNDDEVLVENNNKLSNYGYWLLEGAITDCIIHSD